MHGCRERLVCIISSQYDQTGMSTINFSITIHLQPELKTSYLLSAFLDNELLPTKTFTVADSLVTKKIFVPVNHLY